MSVIGILRQFTSMVIDFAESSRMRIGAKAKATGIEASSCECHIVTELKNVWVN